MTGDHYVVIRVVYDGHPIYGRSLEWIAPELSDAGLTMTEDHVDEPSPWRTWAGVVEGRTFERFADAWQLDAARHERTLGLMTGARHLPTRAYTFDGMNWETGGESPIVYVCVLVGVAGDGHGPTTDDSLRVRLHS
jgi:hypothetical protein